MEPGAQNQEQNIGQGPEQGGQDQGQQIGTGSIEGQQGAQGTAQQAQQPQQSQEVRQQPSEGRQVSKAGAGVLRPPVDVIEDVQGITLIADMPGVSRDNLNLRLEAHSLTIEGALSLELPPDMESRYAEVRHQHYERTFALSRELDGEKATAELAHGVLRVRIPKTQQAQPRKIQVNVAQ